MNHHRLTGLDAQNPLAFFAALGLLRILDFHHCERSLPRPTLSFTSDGLYCPILGTPLEWGTLVETILWDAKNQSADPALRLAYSEAGTLVSPESTGAIRDLKPKPTAAKQFLDALATAPRRSSDLASAFFSELVKDNNQNTKPTSLHFTAGQQTFLAFVENLRSGIRESDVTEALIGPWRSQSTLPSLNWDASSSRNYALRAVNPSSEKRGSVAAANWLAVHALPYFPVVVDASKLDTKSSEKLITTGIRGGWKSSVFRWPLWEPPVTRNVAESLLRIDSRGWTAAERSALGVLQVFRSQIGRSDQGGYGSFSPAAVELPRTPKA